MENIQSGNPGLLISNSIISGGTFYTQSTSIHSSTKSMPQTLKHSTEMLSTDAHVAGYDRLLEMVAPGALHNSGLILDPPKCHPNTRVAIIEKIISWATLTDENTRTKFIMWLTGAAGAGKSSIGRTVAERSALRGTLLATFFFGASDPSRNHSRSLVATIAYQICTVNHTVRNFISTYIDNDPMIFTRALETQFLHLVINPLSGLTNSEGATSSRHLIVIDGLDECLDKASQRNILIALFNIGKLSHIPFRFLVCSRSENQIISTFSSIRMQEVLSRISLDDSYYPAKDIEIYLRDRFAEIKSGHIFKTSIPMSWPTDKIIHDLVNKSSGQFIYAPTVIRYLESSRHRPHHRLDAVLGLRSSFGDLPFVQLDALYMHILSKAENTTRILDVLAFPVLYHQYHVPDIERILNMERGEVEILVSDLWSLVQVKRGYLSLLHKSLADFLLDKERSNSLFVDRISRRVQHLVRVVHMFSESSFQCRLYSVDSLCVFDAHDILLEDVTDVDRITLADAVTDFPMADFCKSLFVHNICACAECFFLPNFWIFLNRATQPTGPIEEGVYNHHAHRFVECLFFELENTYNHNHEVHFRFYSHFWIRGLVKRIDLDFTERWPQTYFIDLIENTFPPVETGLMGDRHKWGFIFARAAAYCLGYLCKMTITRNETKAIVKIASFTRKKKDTYLSRRNARQKWGSSDAPATIWTSQRAMRFLKMRKARALDVYPTLHSHETPYSPSHFTAKHLYNYIYLTKLLIRFLPSSARYDPLTVLCKGRVLAPISILFPRESRRTRREITRYLARVAS